MSPLLNLPQNVLRAIPRAQSDLWSIVLTCRTLHHLLTPTFYQSYSEELADGLSEDAYSSPYEFLRTLRSSPILASYVHQFSLKLPQFKYIVEE